MKYIWAYDRIYELYYHFSLSCCHENLIKIWPFIEYFITRYTLLPSFVLLGQYRCVILLIKSNHGSKQRQISKNDKRIKQSSLWWYPTFFVASMIYQILKIKWICHHSIFLIDMTKNVWLNSFQWKKYGLL